MTKYKIDVGKLLHPKLTLSIESSKLNSGNYTVIARLEFFGLSFSNIFRNLNYDDIEEFEESERFKLFKEKAYQNFSDRLIERIDKILNITGPEELIRIVGEITVHQMHSI